MASNLSDHLVVSRIEFTFRADSAQFSIETLTRSSKRSLLGYLKQMRTKRMQTEDQILWLSAITVLICLAR